MHKTQKRVLFRAAAARARVSSVQEAEIRNTSTVRIYRSVAVNEIATSQPIQIFVSASFVPVFF